MNTAIWVQILSMVLSAAASIIGALVLVNLRQISARIDKTDLRLDRVETEQKFLAARKLECQQEFISTGQFLRESGYTRQRLDQAIEAIKCLEGKMGIMTQLPNIVGKIVSETIKEFKR